jgi:hypothetical protein
MMLATGPAELLELPVKYNLSNFLRTFALAWEVDQWSLTRLRETPVKIGARKQC